MVKGETKMCSAERRTIDQKVTNGIPEGSA